MAEAGTMTSTAAPAMISSLGIRGEANYVELWDVTGAGVSSVQIEFH
jgi:hypothetical protein